MEVVPYVFQTDLDTPDKVVDKVCLGFHMGVKYLNY